MLDIDGSARTLRGVCVLLRRVRWAMMDSVSDFRMHEGWCRNGECPDGRRRLDMFPEWGDAFPLWEGGNGCSTEPLSSGLRSSLYEWNRAWGARADAGEKPSAETFQAWLDLGDQLGRRVEAETDAAVVVLGPERVGRALDCPYCGPAARQRRLLAIETDQD